MMNNLHITPSEDILKLPSFPIQFFREFMSAPDVWGEDNQIFMDDVLLHVEDNGEFLSYTTEPFQNEDSTIHFSEDKYSLPDHSDSAIVYIECGEIVANSDRDTTDFVQVVMARKPYLSRDEGDLHDMSSIMRAKYLSL